MTQDSRQTRGKNHLCGSLFLLFRAKEYDGPAGLSDVLADAEPRLEEVAVVVLGGVEFSPPQDVAVKKHDLMAQAKLRLAAEQVVANGRFP